METLSTHRKNIIFTCFDSRQRIKENINKLSHQILYHTNIESCQDFIELNEHQTIFLIISSSDIDLLLSNIVIFKQVHSIFIFSLPEDPYKLVRDENLNVIGFYHQLVALSSSIDEEILEYNKQFYQWTIFDQDQFEKRDLSKHAHDFLGFHLFHQLLHHLKRDEHAKQQMMDFFRQNIPKNYEFIETYESKDALNWYLNHSFIQQLINQELKTLNFLHLYQLRYFLADLCENLHQQSHSQENFTVYHHTKLSASEFRNMKNYQGKLMLIRGFLLTSDHVEQSDEFINIIFEIQCNIRELGERLIFVDLSQQSDQNQTRKHILFDFNTTFRLENIIEHDKSWLIRLSTVDDGQRITEKYLNDTRRQIDNLLSISIIFGRFLYERCQWYDAEKYFEYLLNDRSDEDLAWIEYFLGQTLHSKGEWTRARDYCDRSYQRMLNSNPIRRKDSAIVLSGIAEILFTEGDYEKAFKLIERALKTQWKSSSSSNHPYSAKNFENLSLIYMQKLQKDKALKYLRKALSIRREYYQDFHIDIILNINYIDSISVDQRKDYELKRAINVFDYYSQSNRIYAVKSINLMSVILRQQKKYDQALNLNEQAIRIVRRLRSSYHFDYANLISLNLIIKYDQNKYDECLQSCLQCQETVKYFYPSDFLGTVWLFTNIANAKSYMKHNWKEILPYYQQALDILKRSYPSYDGCKAAIYNQMGNAFKTRKDYNKAHKCYQKALELQEQYYPSDHAELCHSLRNIGHTFLEQDKYDQALMFYQRDLIIQQMKYPSNDINISDSLNNIGHTLRLSNKLDQALKYYQQVLTIRKNFYLSDHTDIVDTLILIGYVLQKQRKYDEAFDYYQQSLEMQTNLYSSEDIKIVLNLAFMGDIHNDKRNYDIALKFHQKALLIKEKYYSSDDDDDIASSLISIGTILQNQEKYDEALIAMNRALMIRKKNNSPNDVIIAHTLTHIGDLLNCQKKHIEALDVYQQAMDIYDQYYQVDHIHKVDNLYNIGYTLSQLGRDDEALIYHERTLNIQENLLGKNGHIDMIRTLIAIGNILYEQKKFNNVLEYYERSLIIREQFDALNYTSIVNLLTGIGNTLRELKMNDEALRYYQRSVDLFETHKLSISDNIIQSFLYMGHCQFARSSDEKANDLYQQALKLSEQRDLPDHIYIAQLCYFIGACYYHQRMYNQALNFSERSLAHYEKYNGQFHDLIYEVCNQIVTIWNRNGDRNRAIIYTLKCLKIVERCNSLKDPKVSQNISGLAQLYRNTLDHQLSLTYELKCLSLREEIFPPDDINIADSLSNIGLCYDNLNKWNLALEYYRRALQVYEQSTTDSFDKIWQLREDINIILDLLNE